MTRMKRGEPEPETRVGNCAGCCIYPVTLFKVPNIFRYRCADCFVFETGQHHRLAPPDRLHISSRATGLIYADKSRARNGDYVRLAYLDYETLRLHVDKDCPTALRLRIESDAAHMQRRKGERFQIAGNVSIVLGSALP